MIRQVLERLKLQPRQRDVIGIEVDGDDVLGPGDEIVQDVATTRSDCDQSMMRLQLQRIEIDNRIFPDLVVDKAPEHQREETLQCASLAREWLLMRGSLEEDVCHRWAGIAFA